MASAAGRVEATWFAQYQQLERGASTVGGALFEQVGDGSTTPQQLESPTPVPDISHATMLQQYEYQVLLYRVLLYYSLLAYVLARFRFSCLTLLLLEVLVLLVDLLERRRAAKPAKQQASKAAKQQATKQQVAASYSSSNELGRY